MEKSKKGAVKRDTQKLGKANCNEEGNPSAPGKEIRLQG